MKKLVKNAFKQYNFVLKETGELFRAMGIVVSNNSNRY